MMRIRLFSICTAIFLLATLQSPGADPVVVRLTTNLGNIDVTLRPDVAPKTVANFLTYVSSGAYNQSLIHRSIPGFVIQGGGYYLINNNLNTVTANAPVPGEHNLSNVRGTLAMALSNGPNTGTCQWFFNLIDNSSALDGTANGGPFTVFGQVANPASLAVMDQIAAEPTYNASSVLGPPFSNLPLINYNSSVGLQVQNLVLVNSIMQLNPNGTDAPVMPGYMLALLAMGLFIAANWFLRGHVDDLHRLNS